MSPSGFPPSHVSLDAAIVRVIVLPDMPVNTLSSPVVPPKSSHSGSDTVVRAVQDANALLLTEVQAGSDASVSDVQFLNALSPTEVQEGNDTVGRAVQDTNALSPTEVQAGNDTVVSELQP